MTRMYQATSTQSNDAWDGLRWSLRWFLPPQATPTARAGCSNFAQHRGGKDTDVLKFYS